MDVQFLAHLSSNGIPQKSFSTRRNACNTSGEDRASRLLLLSFQEGDKALGDVQITESSASKSLDGDVLARNKTVNHSTAASKLLAHIHDHSHRSTARKARKRCIFIHHQSGDLELLKQKFRKPNRSKDVGVSYFSRRECFANGGSVRRTGFSSGRTQSQSSMA